MTQTQSVAFTFGEPIPVVNGRELNSYLECWFNGRYFEPAISLNGLAKSYKSTPYLSSGIIFKRNFLANLFVPHPKLPRSAFEQIALDFIWCGNAYLEKITSHKGGVINYKPALAKYVRRGEHQNEYWLICSNHTGYNEYLFKNRLFHIKEADIDQEIYGVPEYYAALQSAWHNESATLYSRKY